MGGGMVGQACEVDVGLETSAGPDEWGTRTEPVEGESMQRWLFM